MKLKKIIDEDFINYKKPSMTLFTAYCSFKCCFGCKKIFCQNLPIIKDKTIDVPNDEIVKRYINNNLTEAIVFSGLEPFDQFGELFELIKAFRHSTDDDIVIYTGYEEDEIEIFLTILKEYKFKNIIIKFGRFNPDYNEVHKDEVLGVNLIGHQYGKKIS